jgi:tRNA pseudouridine38-40 synthase
VTLSARRIRLDLSYDGAEFAGWQFQPGLRTVQGVVEQALSELAGGDRVVLRGAGRTDSGVHARQQVADARIESRLDDSELTRALQHLLPVDLRPLRTLTVDDGFHSRKHALRKTYVYQVDISAAGDPLRRRDALHHPHRCELATLREALERIPGRRDWSCFAASRCDKLDRVREVDQAELKQPQSHLLQLVFSADGFLQHMVRNIVGTLLDIAGRRSPMTLLDRLFASGDRDLAGPTAAAHGLILHRVHYADPHDWEPRLVPHRDSVV